MAKSLVFSRYAGSVDGVDNGIRMPTDSFSARVHNVSVSELMGRLESFLSGEEGPEMYPWAKGFAMGYPLPNWQRELKWDSLQKVRFIESIWSGVDVGSYLVNDLYEFAEDEAGRRIYRKFSDALLDGQQRLTTLEAYLFDKFAVPDVNGVPRFWSDLSRIERRRFSGMHFAKAAVQSWDEGMLRRAYDLRLFGGTPPERHERASDLTLGGSGQ